MTVQSAAHYGKSDDNILCDNSEPVFQEMPKGLDFSA